jgi:hypothetical protein
MASPRRELLQNCDGPLQIFGLHAIDFFTQACYQCKRGWSGLCWSVRQFKPAAM